MNHSDMPKNEAEFIAAGHARLSGDELSNRLIGKSFYSLFQAPFYFGVCFEKDGTMYGENNVGSKDYGVWVIEAETGAIVSNWATRWGQTSAVGYAVDGVIYLFLSESGDWQAALLHEIEQDQIGVFT